jgi:hypothetical protein
LVRALKGPKIGNLNRESAGRASEVEIRKRNRQKRLALGRHHPEGGRGEADVNEVAVVNQELLTENIIGGEDLVDGLRNGTTPGRCLVSGVGYAVEAAVAGRDQEGRGRKSDRGGVRIDLDNMH